MDKARKTTRPWIGVLAALLGLYLLYSTGNAMKDRDMAAELTEQMKTACVGRFLIDLPQRMDFSYSRVYMDGFWISTQEESVQAFEARVAARRHAIEAEPNQLGKQNLEAAQDYQNNGFTGKIFRFGRNLTKGEENGKPVDWINVKLEAYVHAGDASFDFIAEDYSIQLIGNLPRLLDKLRLLRAKAIPTAAGFCFGPAMFLDPLPPDYTEGVTLFAGFQNHPDLVLALNTRAGTEPDKEGRLERDTAVDAEMPLWQKPLMSKLRKGKRTINGIEGDEVAEKWNELNFINTYGFDWEVNGTNDNVLLPFMHLEMSTGHAVHAGARPIKSFLGEEALLHLWDKVSSSVRVRPTGAAASAPSRPATGPAPGATASAGQACPASGWWQCAHRAQDAMVAGGACQFFQQGVTLPQAWLLRPQSLWERMRGAQSRYQLEQPTTWALAERRCKDRSC